MTIRQLNDSVTLPSGLVLKNRLAKAAMNEALGDSQNLPDDRIVSAYKAWGAGDWGMLLTGNFAIDPKHASGPVDIAVTSEAHFRENIGRYKAYADAAQAHGGAAIVQLSHPGRQTPMGSGTRGIMEKTLAPSAIPMNIGKGYIAKAARVALFGTPKEMTLEDIADVKQKFVTAAKMVAESGFKGIQLHGAHGYLLSEFATPDTNRRTDKYGGNAENRIRIFLEIIAETRKVVPKGFAIGVKLNSVDQQTASGTDMEDVLTQITLLEKAGIDFLEISGGSYEDPKFSTGHGTDIAKPRREISSRTLAREAFFLEFAKTIRARFPNLLLMVTGGFRTRAGMDDAIQKGCDIVGIGRPACIDPAFAHKILDPAYTDEEAKLMLNSVPIPWLVKQLDVKVLGVGIETSYYQAQIAAFLQGKTPQAP